jgi:arginine deiminase
MIIVREIKNINLYDLSKVLGCINIDKLYIFSINNLDISSKVDIIKVKEPSMVNYIEIGIENFNAFLNIENSKITEYNRDSLYILRNASYIKVKNLLTKINGTDVSIGRGGSQKAHMISPKDFRLSCYLMAMFKGDFKLISYLNTFNDISKDR